ncbi:MAG: hypothetical protein CMP61_12640 [Flavobacteriales bacterium]|nr:hypothetical protein [Flavobacteriales bacterium]|tara:strand:+ start:6889 stop:7401 length:513 start_codon:yes stop_codon:yes gene_type:complete
MDSFLLVVLPLIITNVLHMVVVKRDWLSFFNYPVSKRLFGENKTWRGFIWIVGVNSLLIIPIGCALGWMYSFIKLGLLGAAFGFVYVIFELPNSFLKRRLGIQAGKSSTKYKWLFMFLDKSDSALGVTICIWYANHYQSFIPVLFTFIGLVTIHSSISWLLVALKIKNRF